jgi:chaperonin GroEL
MVTDPERMEAVFEGVRVLLYDGKLNNMKKFMHVLEKLSEQGRMEIVVIAEEVEGEVLSTLVVNKLKGAMKAVAIKAPEYGDHMTNALEDIATLIGGKVVSEKSGIKLEEITLDMLGVAGKVVVTKDTTTIVEGNGTEQAINDRVKVLKSHAKEAKGYDKERLDKRIADLTGGIAVIKVGASTETEMNYLKLKLEDAVNATQAALEEGVVAGGGSALVIAGLQADIKNGTDGEKIVYLSCSAPLERIIQNAGENVQEVLIGVGGRIGMAKGNCGWDAGSGEYVDDMIKAGIIDPLKVTKNALLNAVSAAGTFLTTEVAIANILKEEK